MLVRHIVVTGGGTGIGFGIAARLRDAGEQVTITGPRKDVLEDAADRIDVAGTVDFLVSDAAARITGQVIHVNGALTSAAEASAPTRSPPRRTRDSSGERPDGRSYPGAGAFGWR